MATSTYQQWENNARQGAAEKLLAHMSTDSMEIAQDIVDRVVDAYEDEWGCFFRQYRNSIETLRGVPYSEGLIFKELRKRINDCIVWEGQLQLVKRMAEHPPLDPKEARKLLNDIFKTMEKIDFFARRGYCCFDPNPHKKCKGCACIKQQKPQ